MEQLWLRSALSLYLSLSATEFPIDFRIALLHIQILKASPYTKRIYRDTLTGWPEIYFPMLTLACKEDYLPLTLASNK